MNRRKVIAFGLFISGLLSALAFTKTLSAFMSGQQAAADFNDQRLSVRVATFWLVQTHQNDDGGYASFSTGANQAPSSVGGTLDAMLAIAAGGFNPAVAFPGKVKSPLDFLVAHEADVVAYAEKDRAQAGKLVLALTASSADPRDFLGRDFVNTLQNHYSPSGDYSVADPFKQSLAILGLVSAGAKVPAQALQWLEDRQADGGAWDDGFGTEDNPGATAMAIMALLAAGRPPTASAIVAGKSFLAASQSSTGGWAYAGGFEPSSNSTALVIQALSSLGEDWVSADGPWSRDGGTPLTALLSFQSDNGAFQSDFGTGPFDDFFATVQSIPAAAGRPFPLLGRREVVRRALVCLDSMQDIETGGWASFAGGEPDASGTSRAIQAIVAAGEDPQDQRWTNPGGTDAVEALEALAPAFLSEGRGGRVGVVMQGVVAAGSPSDVSNFAGEDLPLLMSGYLSPTGEYDTTAFGIFAHAEAMLGLARSGEPVASQAVDFLLAADNHGDWGDPDSNGIALQVLGALGWPAPGTTLTVLHADQESDGGWGFGGVSNPSATAEVVQGLAAAGLNPFGPDWSKMVSGVMTSPAEAVVAAQSDNGCWPNQFGPGDDPYSTVDAILLLAQSPGWGLDQVFLPNVVSVETQ